MNSDKKEIDYTVPTSDEEVTGPIPDLDMFDDDGPSQEFSYAGGFGFWVSQKKADQMKASGKTPMFGHGAGQFFKQAWFRLKQASFWPMRGAYLIIVKLNVWDQATKLANAEKLAPTHPDVAAAWNKILLHWVHFGGDISILKHNIELGKGKKPLITRVSKQVKLIPFDGKYSNAVGADDAVEVAASTSIWVPIIGALGSVAGVIGKLAMHPDDQKAADAAAANPANQLTPADQAKAQAQLDLQKQALSEGKEPTNQASAIIPGVPDMALYVVGGLAILGIGYLILKKK